MKIHDKIDLSKVAAFRGSVDFYFWRGQPVARTWPKVSNQPNTPAQIQSRSRLTAAVEWAKAQPVGWSAAWKNSPNTPGRSYRDRYLSEAIRAQSYTTLPDCPEVIHSEITPAIGPNPPALKLKLADGYTSLYPFWSVCIRAQPPNEPPITYYDSGWYQNRCIAIYKYYQPIVAGFKVFDPLPSLEEPSVWNCFLYAEPDAVSWYLTPKTLPPDPAQYPAMLYPPTMALHV